MPPDERLKASGVCSADPAWAAVPVAVTTNASRAVTVSPEPVNQRATACCWLRVAPNRVWTWAGVRKRA